MLKSLSLLAMLGAGMLGAENATPQVVPVDFSFHYAGGRPEYTVTLSAPGAAFGGLRNSFAPISIVSTNADDETVAWHLAMPHGSTDSADLEFHVSTNRLNPPPDTAFTGMVELYVHEGTSYSDPVTVHIPALEGGELGIDGHTLKLEHIAPGDEDGDGGESYWLVERDVDTSLIGLEVGAGGECATCVFEKKGDRALIHLPSFAGEKEVAIRAIYGKGLHKVSVPLHFTVDFLCGAYADVPQELEFDCRREEFPAPGVQEINFDNEYNADGSIHRLRSISLQNIFSPEGVSFHPWDLEKTETKQVADGTKLTVSASIRTQEMEAAGRNPHVATLSLTAEWNPGTEEEIDSMFSFSIPAYQTVGDPLHAELTPDGKPQELTFAGRTFTATLTEADGDVRLELRPYGEASDIEILFNGKTPRPHGDSGQPVVYEATIPVDEDGYILTFFETEDIEPVVVPVHVKGHTGLPVKNEDK